MWIERDVFADKKTMDNPGTYLNHVYTEILKKKLVQPTSNHKNPEVLEISFKS